jgi:hypothetical protein
VPVNVLIDVEILRAEELVAGLGLNAAVVPEVKPETVNSTGALNPLEGTTLMT